MITETIFISTGNFAGNALAGMNVSCEPPVLALLVREGSTVDRPRHPERTALYQLFERHFDDCVRAHEERFERKAGALRPVVARTVSAYLDCGRLFGGFARLRCPAWKRCHLLAFSCQTRNFCPSCQAKRAALFAQKLECEIAAPVPHLHPSLHHPPRTARCGCSAHR